MNIDLSYDYSEALKRCGFNQAQVDVLRESAKKHAIIPKYLTNKQVRMTQMRCWHNFLTSPNLEPFQLLLYLNTSDGDIDKATQILMKHYDIRKKALKLFTRRDVTLPEMKQCLENQYYLNFPPTADNNLVCFFGLQNTIAKNYHYDESTTIFLMMIRKQSFLTNEQINKC